MRNVLALELRCFSSAPLVLQALKSVCHSPRRDQDSGVGNSVGDVSATPGRTAAFDRTAFMERLSQPETVFGRVLAIDIPGGKLHLETGGSSHDEGRAGTGAMSSLTLYLDEKTNLDQIRALNAGDDISVQVMEPVNQRAEQVYTDWS